MKDPYTLHTLENGLHVVIERMPDVRSAAAGFMVRTGARDEVAAQAGVSHFLEHMMFKGTAKRHWREVTVDFDRMGSIYNAYTSEDRTMFYGWVRMSDIGKQMELLADMLRPTIPVDEFDTEKKVVLEEIAMSKDSLEHVAFDFLQEKVFAGHPLAWPILGYEETVEALTRDQMHAYFEQRYVPQNLLLVVAGNVDPAEIIGHAESLCAEWKAGEVTDQRTAPVLVSGEDDLLVERFKQQVIAITVPSVGGSDPRAETASAVATILGGDNSRFFWNIVQTGLSPRAGSFHLEYTDFGAMILFGACQPESADQLLEALRTEAGKLTSEGAEAREVDRVKNRRRTTLALEAEAPYHRLTQLMDDVEYFGAPRGVEQMLAAVDSVTVDSIRDYLAEFSIDSGGHLARVGATAA